MASESKSSTATAGCSAPLTGIIGLIVSLCTNTGWLAAGWSGVGGHLLMGAATALGGVVGVFAGLLVGGIGGAVVGAVLGMATGQKGASLGGGLIVGGLGSVIGMLAGTIAGAIGGYRLAQEPVEAIVFHGQEKPAISQKLSQAAFSPASVNINGQEVVFNIPPRSSQASSFNADLLSRQAVNANFAPMAKAEPALRFGMN